MTFKEIQKSIFAENQNDYDFIKEQEKISNILLYGKNPYFIVTTKNQCRRYSHEKYLDLMTENFMFEIDIVRSKEEKIQILDNAIFVIKDLINEYNIKKKNYKSILDRIYNSKSYLNNIKIANKMNLKEKNTITKIKTELKKLSTKTQKINYINRYITDYRRTIDNDFFELDETLNFLKSELKFWENFIEEPEQQTEIFKNIEWNKDVIDLSELIYVLVKSESIYKNGKNITQKDLTEIFNKIFNTDFKDVSDNLYKGFQTYKRSDDKKTYIKSLYEIIEQYIIDKNNRK